MFSVCICQRFSCCSKILPPFNDILGGKISHEDFSEMGRSLGELQRELEVVREREEERDKRTELSLEELENLIAAKEEDSNQRFQQQAQENAENIKQVPCAGTMMVQTKHGGTTTAFRHHSWVS